MISPAQQIFLDLPGKWSLHRDIPGYGQIKGQVEFSELTENRLVYHEEGSLSLETGQTLSTSRSYIYELVDDKIIILYNDPTRQGDVLHELVFISQEDAFVSRHCHTCALDTYDLIFRFGVNRNIEMFYQIKGPKKDYTLQSLLTRSPV
jgi:hypothetical protein